MTQKQVHVRDFLVPAIILDRKKEEYPPYMFFDQYINGWLPPCLQGKTERRGIEASDYRAAVISDDDEEKLCLIQHVGLFVEDQSYTRFVVSDLTHESFFIAAARHAMIMGAPIRELVFPRLVRAEPVQSRGVFNQPA